MKIYLVQHGEAVAKDLNPERPLSARGRGDIERLGRVMSRAGARPCRIIHSGKTRARQTAEILAGAVAPGVVSDSLPGLAPREPVEPLLAQIEKWMEDTLVVGHQPFLGSLVSALLGIGQREILAYRPGTLAGLESAPNGDWRLIWLLRPELL